LRKGQHFINKRVLEKIRAKEKRVKSGSHFGLPKKLKKTIKLFL